MAYKDTVTGLEIEREISVKARNLRRILLEVAELKKDIDNLTAGKNATDMQTQLGWDAAKTASANAVVNSMAEVHDFANNLAPAAQDDRLDKMRSWT